METAGHEKVLAIQFAKFIKTNYRIIKGGKYRHRGDFYNNTHPINEIQLFDIFITFKNDGLCNCVPHYNCECNYQNQCQECGFQIRKTKHTEATAKAQEQSQSQNTSRRKRLR